MEFNMVFMNLIPLVVLVALICCTGVVVLIFFDLVRAKQGPKHSALPPSPLQTQYQPPDGAEAGSGAGMAGSSKAGLQTGTLSSVALRLGVIKNAAGSGSSKGRSELASPKDAGAAERGGPAAEEDSPANREGSALPAMPRPMQTENNPDAPAASSDLAGRTGAEGSSPQPPVREEGGIVPSSKVPSPAVTEGGVKNADPSTRQDAAASVRTKSLTGSEMRSIAEGKNAGNTDAKEERGRGSEAGAPNADSVMDLLGATPQKEAPQAAPVEGDDPKKSSSVFVDIPEHLIASAEKSSENPPVTLFMSSATEILQKADAAAVAKELPKHVSELKTSLITLRTTLQRLKGPDDEEKTAPT